MLRSNETTPAAPPCHVCTQPSETVLWSHPVCRGCHSDWLRTSTPLHALELAHADAHPEDVEQRGEQKYLTTGQTDGRWVILKGDITARIAKAAAEAWLRDARSKARKPRAA
jgi:hypothetical protein